MTEQIAIHCLKAIICEEVCEECELYGQTGTDHCEADAVRIAIEALEKQAEYKSLEEQGLLLRLPCKVGDKVYQIHTLPKSNRKVLAEVIADEFFITLCTLEKRFGKSVFLTKEEAEVALEKMKGE